MRSVVSLVALSAMLSLSACDPLEEPFVLPEGDPVDGKMQFVSLGCASCHSVVGAEVPEPSVAGPVKVLLGGRRMSYGQLVTAIVNPSHRLPIGHRRTGVSEDGESRMTAYNDVLTMTQLTDLVAFLQLHYTAAERPGYEFPVYDYTSDAEAGADVERPDP